MTQLQLLGFRSFRQGGIRTTMEVYLPRRRDSEVVGVVFTVTNPTDAPPWEPTEALVINKALAPIGKRAALRAMPLVIPPGEPGRVALVFSSKSVGLDEAQVTTTVLFEILRDRRPELAVEVPATDIRQRWSP